VRSTLSGKKFQIGLATVVFLVGLRLLIGAMFYWGAVHKAETGFTSAYFLQGAKGPLASLYQNAVPDYYGWRATIETPRQATRDQSAEDIDRLDRKSDEWKAALKQWREDNAGAYKDWQAQVEEGWWALRQKVHNHYGFDETQEKTSRAMTDVFVARLNDHLLENAGGLIAYRHDLYQEAHRQPGPELPALPNAAENKGAAMGVQAWTKKTEQELLRDLRNLATTDQLAKGDLPVEKTSIETVDNWVIKTHMVIGVCLLAGLFTRLAFFGAGAFILSVVASQPPWVADANPWLWGQTAVGYQACIMLVCFALMFSHVGRWAGLDYFINKLIGRRCCGGEGEA